MPLAGQDDITYGPRATAKMVNISVAVDTVTYDDDLVDLWKAKYSPSGMHSYWPLSLVWPHVELESGITESADVQYQTTDVPMRIEPFQSYTGSGPRSVELVLPLRAYLDTSDGYLNDGNSDNVMESDYTEIMFRARWLESFKHPVLNRTTGIAYAPPPVILTIGRLFLGRCIVTSCNPQWDGPFTTAVGEADNSMLPHGATLNAGFTVVRAAPGTDYASWPGFAETPPWNRFLAHEVVT